MRPIHVLVVSALLVAPASADIFACGANQFEIDFVDIGNAGNAADGTPGYGGVGYAYRMGTYEVSRAMIDAYNAVSGGPPLTMHDMTSYGGNGVNRPATGISWNEAARFVNWLNTQHGYDPAYKFTTSGVNDNIELWEAADGSAHDPNNPYRNPNAVYFLPSEDEWYKAGYFDPDTVVYWDYATGSDNVPIAVPGGTMAGTAVYLQAASSGPADITNAGGLSAFGTMGQNGNAWEWIESGVVAPNDSSDESRVFRGGPWGHGEDLLQSSLRYFGDPTSAGIDSGFRVASIPVPFDIDGDGLADVVETGTGTFVSASDTGTIHNNPDTDADGVPDGLEVKELTDPNDPLDYAAFSKGMLAYYPFNGNAGDETGGGAPGTANGAILALDRYGHSDSAYSFNGADSSVRVPATLQAAGDYALSMWIKCQTPDTGWYSLLGRDGWADGWLYFGMDGDSIMHCGVGGESINTRLDLDAVAGWLADDWNHVVVSRDTPGLKYVYHVNGQHVLDIPLPSTYSPVRIAPMEIGSWRSNLNGQRTRFFIGGLDDIRIYDRPLSAAQAVALYHSERPMFVTLSTIGKGEAAGAGGYVADTTAALTVTPDPGYKFTGWTGDASGTANPLSVLMDSDKTIGATFEPDLADDDGDGLTNYQEGAVYGTDPDLPDTDGDGLTDAYEVGIGRYSLITGGYTWGQARTDAVTRGGYLATFTSQEEWDIAIASLGPNALDSITGAWIGATDAAQEGTWTWITGEPFGFERWGPGQPDDFNNSDVAEVSGGFGAALGRWFDTGTGVFREGYILEVGYRTNAIMADTDADGLNDGQEQTAGSNPFLPDTDGDGLTDGHEVFLTLTDPTLGDTGATGTPDGEKDPDADGLDNLAEVNTHGTDPRVADTDGDGVDDGDEVSYDGSTFTLVQGAFTWPQAAADASARGGRVAAFPAGADYGWRVQRIRGQTAASLWIGLTDEAVEGTWVWSDGSSLNYNHWLAGQPDGGAGEKHVVIFEGQTTWADAVDAFVAGGYVFEYVGLNPKVEDSDGDGLTDGRELNTVGSSPAERDTDHDGLPDGEEVNTHGSDPTKTDTDGDGLGDYVEVTVHGSNPAKKDSDDDGFEDLFEVNTGFDPASATSTPEAYSVMLTAVEFRFNAAAGVAYKIESSLDLEDWGLVETGIIGEGDTVVRFYTIEATPKRYFRARRE